jgi:hypothetical protein
MPILASARGLIPVLLSVVLVAAGCRSASTAPGRVVNPELVGHWASERLVDGSTIRITLVNGQLVDIDQARTQLALGNGGERHAATLILSGSAPHPWFVQLNPQTAGHGFPVGCYSLSGVNAFDSGDTIVISARPDTAPPGTSGDFGIRLPKATGMDPPPTESAPWYGYLANLCIDGRGSVTRLVPPSGP